jgi:hypothetical protein
MPVLSEPFHNYSTRKDNQNISFTLIATNELIHYVSQKNTIETVSLKIVSVLP